MSLLELLKMKEEDRIRWLEGHIWPHLSKMLAAVAAGVRSVAPQARFSTHTSGVAAVRPKEALAFYRAMKRGGFFPDELGFSFYPSSSETPPQGLTTFQRTVEAVHKEFGRPVFIAEFAYPAERVREGAFSSWNHALDGYPLTPAGQAKLLRDLTRWAIGAGVSGIRPWAPETAVPGWEPFALFRQDGAAARARPSLSAIADALRSRKQ
jgi:arabinogalactan endo-1,4-beta-galactosidase